MKQITHNATSSLDSFDAGSSWSGGIWNSEFWGGDVLGGAPWGGWLQGAVWLIPPGGVAHNTVYRSGGDQGSSSITPAAISSSRTAGGGRTSKTTSASSGSSTGPATSTTSSGNSATSPFVINVTWDASVASAPSGFTAGVMQAVQFLESQFVNPITINIDVGYGEIGGYSLGSNSLGASGAPDVAVSYGTLRSALAANAGTATQSSVVASLPATAPVSGTFYVSAAEAEALGLSPPNSTSADGYIGLSSTLPFTYSDSSGVASGTYDFEGTVLHEITEVMGRTMDFGATASSNYMLYDLLHYSAPGIRDFSSSTPGYFSPDGGVTNDGSLNTISGGDGADWASSMGADSLDAFASSGTVNAFSADDLLVMEALGWAPVGSATTQPVSSAAPTGVTVAPSTTSMALALSGPAEIATVSETGGGSSDSYRYTLGGNGAAAFTLATVNNAAYLASGAAGLAGSASGTLYALTLTATDLTTGQAAPATAVDVIVAGSGNDTISAAKIAGNAASGTPTLLYGGAGNDTLDATGLTGNVWFVIGAGADKMIAGSGSNDFIYSDLSGWTASATDVISNFAVTMDTIDLTGLGTPLQYVGAIKKSGSGANKIAAHSIGVQSSGGNTYVYVNTGSSSESLSGSNIKIELLGSVSLRSNNFLHQ